MPAIKSFIVIITTTLNILFDAAIDKQETAPNDFQAGTTVLSDTINVDVLNRLSEANWMINPSKSIQYGKKARQLALEINYKVGELLALNNIAMAYAMVGFTNKSQEYFSKSLQIAETIEYDKIGVVYNNLGKLYYDALGDYEKALETLQKSVKAANGKHDEILANSFHGIGAIHWKLGDFDQALKSFAEAKNYYERIRNTQGIVNVLINSGRVCTQIGDYQNGLRHYSNALAYCQNIEDKGSTIVVLNGMGEIQLKLSNPRKSLEYHNKALVLAKAIDDKRLTKDTNKYLSNTYYAIGHYQQAMDLLKTWHIQEDSIVKVENRENNARIQTVIELERKEKEIELLKAEDERDDIIKNTFIVGSFLLFALGINLYRSNRFKQRMNQELSEKNVGITSQNKELSQLNDRLQRAVEDVKQLSGLLPICASCKKIRDDKGYWQQLEVYIKDHSQAEFSHAICPDCMKELYGDFLEEADEAI